ncbi:MAG: pseudaminic acid cytidylyltransferase [Lachnospiraceae bacterium]|nr:pseudaminic acid cytidylyltransferase [Lachnospiraceae bacterium]
MSSIAIITARGGSKRIPHKNIKEFLGKPIICYAIEAAIGSRVFDEVMVSTDDPIIADIAKDAGAKVPFMRSEKNAGDFATTADAIREVLDAYKKEGREFDEAAVIYPTAPFVTAEKLRDAMSILNEKSADSVLPVVRFSFPPQRAFVLNEDRLGFAHEEYAMARSQDLQPYYHDCGQFCCFRTKVFLKENKLVTDNTVAVIYPESEVQDIDTLEDWKIAEIKYSMIRDKHED